MADRVLTNALALLATRVEDPKAHLVPSRPVEQGWQALVLHTEVYADLCSRMGGGFIHHSPLQTVPPQRLLTYTANRIAGCGHHIDYDLWQAEGSGEEQAGIDVASL
ncbi:hypothetical protein [Streptomyces sp. NPDC053560]|uniref:hypothetical protein n=1 Tax=Streptomyces sp. NPDC053560 TaxID=3365711 RepID=UPI0037D50831